MMMTNDFTNTIMRTVSFVERIEVEFHGNIMTNAMILADVDNDMANELVVGNVEGLVAIFKSENSLPWRKATVSGMLTCLAVGKIHQLNKNSLICMTAEGWCYIYDFSSETFGQTNNSAEDDGENRFVKPVYSQELPANAKVMCLADIDSDGHIELVIGYSDRVVRAFRWKESSDSELGQFVLIQRWQLAGQIGSITINYNRYLEPELMVSQPGATFVTLLLKPTFRHIKSDSYLDKMIGFKNDNPLERNGSFAFTTKPDVPSSTFKCEVTTSKSDIASNCSDSLTNRALEGSLEANKKKLMPQKSSGNKEPTDETDRTTKLPERLEDKYKTKLSLDKTNSSPFAKTSSSSPDCSDHASDKSVEKLNNFLDTLDTCDEEIFRPNLIYHPLANMQTRNKDTSTVIVGGINRGKTFQTSNNNDSQNTATYYALATLDGSLFLVENDCILWSLQVDHYLFALSKLDVTGNGQEEVVCCSWGGQTYIINHSKEIVRYNFPESVAAFCTGNYSLKGDETNSPCFVYATFNNRIYIYTNITLPRVESTNLLEVMNRKPETHHFLQKLNIADDDHEKLRKLYRWCLYGVHKKL